MIEMISKALSFFTSKKAFHPLVADIIRKATLDMKVIGRRPLENTWIVYASNTFDSTSDEITALEELGVDREHIIAIKGTHSQPFSLFDIHRGRDFHDPRLLKLKSTFEHLEEKWRAGEKIIAIADDDPKFFEIISKKNTQQIPIVGIEKIAFKASNLSSQPLPLPVIKISDCAIKQLIDPSLLAEETLYALTEFTAYNFIEPKATNKWSIVGNNAISKALAEKLSSLGRILRFAVKIYDADNKELDTVKIVENSDYIFNCTGQDIKGLSAALASCKANKNLVNVVSISHEKFVALLDSLSLSQDYSESNWAYGKQLIRKITNYLNNADKNDKDVINYRNKAGARISILNNICPLVFENALKVSPILLKEFRSNAALRTALNLVSILQAANMLSESCLADAKTTSMSPKSYSLSSRQQFFIAQRFLECRSDFPGAITDQFKDIATIEKNSGSVLYNK